MATTSYKTRLEKIRVNFLFDHPFLSVLALSIPMIERENRHESFETDGFNLYADPNKLELYSDVQLKYQFAHILLHIMLKHPFRMKSRDPKVWNRSCDIAINLLLDQFERIGERPEDEVLLKKFDNKSVEAIYAELYRESQEGEGSEESEEKKEEKRDLIESEGDTKDYEADIDAVIVQAVAAAKKAGSIPSTLLELIDEVTRPQIDLQSLLHAYMSESFFDKVSDFSRPNRRFIYQGLYLPGYSKERNRLAVSIGLDRSMSITPEVFKKFLGIIDTVLSISSDYTVTVVPFDEKVEPKDVVTYDAQSGRKNVAFAKSNGGTDFGSLVHYLQNHQVAHEQSFLIVLSDGFFSVNKMVDMPTLFLISDVNNIARLKPYGDVLRFDL